MRIYAIQCAHPSGALNKENPTRGHFHDCEPSNFAVVALHHNETVQAASCIHHTLPIPDPNLHDASFNLDRNQDLSALPLLTPHWEYKDINYSLSYAGRSCCSIECVTFNTFSASHRSNTNLKTQLLGKQRMKKH